jgi:competence protein ComEA
MTRKSTRWVSLRRISVVQILVCGAAVALGSHIHGLQISAAAQSSTSGSSSGSNQAAPSDKQTPAGTHAGEFPDGPGKRELMQVCTQCHSATLVMAKQQDRQGWEETITKMAGLGANATDEQFTVILDYLVKNYSPLPSTQKVNVNTATAAEIASGLGLSDADAQAIVTYRTQNGPFKSVDDLKRIPKLDEKKLSASANLVAF